MKNKSPLTILEFGVLSGGTIRIDLSKCVDCETNACIEVCATQGGPLVLDPSYGVPSSAYSKSEILKGKCVECLGCELECMINGLNAVAIELPVLKLE